jgi:hypothetical protein
MIRSKSLILNSEPAEFGFDGRVESISNIVPPSEITLAAHGETTTAAALHLFHGP